ncbi:MAG: NUDIX hydrolase [Planctomycetes bacterium]|nr:NUDIX hydrolase [Planctomycetota bacterium]
MTRPRAPGITQGERAALLELLERYQCRWPGEEAAVGRVVDLTRSHADCLLRTCLPGHITAAAWIVSPDGGSFLLTHHKKLGRWLQLGGHVDGEPLIHAAALREAQEESGMEHFILFHEDARPLLVDVDVHVIPAHGNEPRHEHHDLRYLLVAAPGQTARASHEAHELRWFPRARLAEAVGDESVQRLARKAWRLLDAAAD